MASESKPNPIKTVFKPKICSKLATMGMLAEALAENNDFDEAVALMEQCIEGCARTFGVEHLQTATARMVLGHILCHPRVARLEEGMRLIRSAAEQCGAPPRKFEANRKRRRDAA